MGIATATENQDFQLSLHEIESIVFKTDERRSSARFADQVELQIAPVFDDQLPLESFRLVVGRDISQGGVSFFMNNPPFFKELDVELGRGATRICLRAEVVSSKRVAGLEPYSLVSCRFLGRSAR